MRKTRSTLFRDLENLKHWKYFNIFLCNWGICRLCLKVHFFSGKKRDFFSERRQTGGMPPQDERARLGRHLTNVRVRKVAGLGAINCFATEGWSGQGVVCGAMWCGVWWGVASKVVQQLSNAMLSERCPSHSRPLGDVLIANSIRGALKIKFMFSMQFITWKITFI